MRTLSFSTRPLYPPTAPRLKFALAAPGLHVSYLVVRQLSEFKTGSRSTGASALVEQAVEQISLEDIIALAAYVGSLEL